MRKLLIGFCTVIMLISFSSSVWAHSDEDTSIIESIIQALVVRVFMLEQRIMELESGLPAVPPMEADQTVTAAPPTSALMVDIYDVQKDFKDNEFAAQQKYYDIVVEVSGGEIEVIKSRLLGGFAVRLSTPTDLDHSVVSCLVDHVQDVIDVSIGDIVTVRGTGGRSGASELDLAACLIVT